MDSVSKYKIMRVDIIICNLFRSRFNLFFIYYNNVFFYFINRIVINVKIYNF